MDPYIKDLVVEEICRLQSECNILNQSYLTACALAEEHKTNINTLENTMCILEKELNKDG